MDQPLLRVERLYKSFAVAGSGSVQAVSDVSFSLARGEILGLVGESGCGKSTLGMTVAQLHRPTSGQVLLEGRDLAALHTRQLRTIRRQLQVIFQDPSSSLDPRMTVMALIAEPLVIAGMPGEQRRERVRELMDLVRLDGSFADRYIHELSGGQRQRIGIARALACDPQLIICDEPISALDVSIQAQILNLLLDLRDRLGIAYLFISHDIASVVHVSDRIAVMYLGKIIEVASAENFVQQAAHPYTKALLAAVPDMNRARASQPLAGEVPSPANPPSGCHFRTRCPIAQPVCTTEAPVLRTVGAAHEVSCHFA